MIQILNKNFYKNGYLLIIAAWLYTISFIFSNYWSYSSSPSRVQKQIESSISNGEQTFSSFVADTSFVQQLSSNLINKEKAEEYNRSDIGLFVYLLKSGSLSLCYWNTNKMIPDSKDLQKPDGKYFSEYANGKFEIIKRTSYYNGKLIITAALIPIYWSYFFKNEYLRSEFKAVNGIEKKYKIVSSTADFYIRNGDGNVLFGMQEKKNSTDESPGGWSLTLRVVAIIFVLIFLNVYAFDIVQKKGWRKGFLFLALTILFLRFLSYVLPFPFNFRSLPLFASDIYGSNRLHPSLGDLLINIILVFWLVSFVKFSAGNYLKRSKPITGRNGWWATGLLSIILIVLAFTSAGIIRSLISDSTISFDVTRFFSLDMYSLLSFIILCFITLTFFHFSHFPLLFLRNCTDVPVYVKYVVVSVAGLLYLSFNLGNPASTSNLIVLVWVLLYMGIMEYRKEDIFVPILKSSFFLIWLIFFAASISALIIYQHSRKALQQHIKIAENIADEGDHGAELLMSIGMADINNEFLSNNYERLTVENSNKLIKDSLMNDYFTGYLNKYDARIYTFDSFHHPLYNDNSLSYDAIVNLINNRSKKAPDGEMYFYQNSFKDYNLLFQKNITDSAGAQLGHLFVLAEPKRYKSPAVYPELFKEVEDVTSELDLTYAVYFKGELIRSIGDYNFPGRIAPDQYLKQQYKEVRKGNTNELWYNAGNYKLVITVQKEALFLEFITLFAYLFGSFLFIVVLFQVGDLFIRYRFRLHLMRHKVKFNIRNQIQGAIIFISIFSFIVIGVSTISFYITRFNQNNTERLVKAIKTLGNEIEAQVVNNHIFDDGVEIYDPGASKRLEQTIREISEIHDVETNFYDLDGNLKVSTQPYIYKRQILSKKMSPGAFLQLHYQNDMQVIQEEQVSHFSFLSIYTVIKDEEGKPYAYLNIPYLNTQLELNQEISNFLVTLINLNAFIFVIAGAISVLLTNRITKSFSLITEKMNNINLGKANENITWNTNDEIGALVKEYNKMVQKLEESAHALAKSEREGAWREMARQVAHEIKNPLTPMKLSIQYLQRAIHEKNPNMQELSQKVSSTLVEQIDQLAKIASDFSQFANLSYVHTERFDLTEVLTSLINLYIANEKLHLTFEPTEMPAMIEADRSQMNRLFTNLFQNAIEASDTKEIISLSIKCTLYGKYVKVDVSDEGYGITLEKQSKIFTPNFTTKTSGTGLGLAICKGITENANGKIWFDTHEGEGTTFHVLLPLSFDG